MRSEAPIPTKRPGLGERAADAMFWNLVGKFALLILRFAESVILVRLLGDAGYGALSQGININAIAVLAAALGLENTLLRFLPEAVARRGTRGERALVGQTILVRVLTSALAAWLIWWQSPWLAEKLFGDVNQQIIVQLAAILLIAMGLQNLMARVLVARYDQRFLNLSQAVLTAVYLAAAALVVSLGGGVAGVMACVIGFNGAVFVVFLLRWRRENPLAPATPAPATEPPPTVVRMLRFSGYVYIYNFLQFVFQKGMDVLLLGLLLDDLAPVAWYVLAYNFVFHSISFFSMAFAEGFPLALIAEVAGRHDEKTLRRFFALSMEYLYLFVIPVAFGGLIIGSDILHLLYPPETADHAVAPMLVLLFGLSFAKMGGITANFLQGMDRERLLVRVRVIFGIVNLVLDIACIQLWGALGAAIATGASVSAGVAYEWYLVHRIIRPVYPWRFLTKIAIASAAMTAVLLAARGTLAWPLAAKVPAMLLGGVATFAGVLMILRPFRREHADLLKKLPLPAREWWLERMVGHDELTF